MNLKIKKLIFLRKKNYFDTILVDDEMNELLYIDQLFKKSFFLIFLLNMGKNEMFFTGHLRYKRNNLLIYNETEESRIKFHYECPYIYGIFFI